MARTLIFFLAAVLWADTGVAEDFFALTPDSAAAGETVVLTGRFVPSELEIVLGDHHVPPGIATEERIEFIVPPLPPGQYALAVGMNSRRVATPFTLRIVEPSPRAGSVIPEIIDECSENGEREVLVEGWNIQPGAALLLDGIAVPVTFESSTQLAFIVPQIRPGRHELRIINPDGRSSLPLFFGINGVPEIIAVTQGADHVNAYELVISGKNFGFTSALVVDGHRISVSPGLPPQADRVEYLDCRTLVYHRYPYSRELKRTSLQVVNPGGEQSPVFFVTIP